MTNGPAGDPARDPASVLYAPMDGSFKFTVAYDGSGFVGSQRQTHGRSVQAELETAISRLYGQPTTIALAGRTDAGVHAIGQVASVEDGRPAWSDAQMAAALNALLPQDLSVVGCERRPVGFHARFDATWREYRYRIWCGYRQPLQRQIVWQRRSELDVAKMSDAASRLIGEIDLASFAGNGVGVPGAERIGPRGTIRTIRHCSVRPIAEWWGIAPAAGQGVEIRIIADGFLPQVVRTIASALAEVGQQRRSPEWIDSLIAAKDRRLGPQTAPPHGLILWRVGYGQDDPLPDPVSEQTESESVRFLANG